jgi:hypothetical protein
MSGASAAVIVVTGGPRTSGARVWQTIWSTGFFGSSCHPGGGSGATLTTNTDSASSMRLVSWFAARAEGSPTAAKGTMDAGYRARTVAVSARPACCVISECQTGLSSG